jgi:hypothetical protein
MKSTDKQNELLVSWAYSLILKMGAIYSSETPAGFLQTTLHYVSGDPNRQL